jgi:haloalkane dehalogenase
LSHNFRYQTHREYLWAFIDAVIGPEPVIMVVPDWGSALGFEWAMRHSDRIAGLAYMEAFVRPFAGWGKFPASAAEMLQQFRTAAGKEMVLNQNIFVERLVQGTVIRRLLDEEMSEYRRPFGSRSDRWPTLSWPREIPVGGEPGDVTAIMNVYGKWLATSDTPKLFVSAEAGAVFSGARFQSHLAQSPCLGCTSSRSI